MNPMRTVFLSMLLALLFVAGHTQALEGGTLLIQEVLREKPKAKGKVLATIDKGIKVQIVAQKDEWYRVTIDNKWVGWIPKTSLRRHDATFGSGVNTLDSSGGTSSFGGASSIQAAPSTGGK